MVNYLAPPILLLFGVIFTLHKSTSGDETTTGKPGPNIGKLICTENGLYPDDELIGVVMQKCQPKLDDPRNLLIACMTKCMMKQLKAVTKKGKMKKNEAAKLATLLPAEHQDSAKAKFDECYKSHQGKVKKESKCDSWVPFSQCFVGWAESICKKGSGNSTTPEPA